MSGVEESDAHLAERLAAEAGEILLSLQRSSGLTGKELGKAGDEGANIYLMRALRAARPEDGLLSEETECDGVRLAKSRVWIVDPLDGTREYGEARTDWAVHVALAINGVPVLGAVALPGLDLVLRSNQPNPIPPPTEKVRMVVSRTRPAEEALAVADMLAAELVPMGSAGAKAMAVVRGEADIYLHSGGQYEWDSCAPAAVAAAHGLHISRIDGAPLIYNQVNVYMPDLLICRKELAPMVLDTLRASAPDMATVEIKNQQNQRSFQYGLRKIAMPTGFIINTVQAHLEQDTLRAAAMDRAGLFDFGDEWFFEPMDRYLDAINREGQLTPAGIAGQSEVIVKGLVSRLRLIDDLKHHPEIRNEKVEVAGIILGLPRTGSTIFHRLLAHTPGMTSIRWYEAQNFAPFPGEEKGNPTERRAYARAMIDSWLAAAPELASIHPLDPDAPDEEILILGQMFVSTMIEGMAFVPSFAAWLNDYDQTKGHEDLKVILQYLQWQDPSRRGQRWILKSPSNLPYAEVAARAFPDALMIMTHRDPLQTVPSYVSMQAALYKLSARVSDQEVGAFWLKRLTDWMQRFQAARGRIGEERFIDIDYREVARAPLDQALRVLTRMGINPDAGVDLALAEFMAGNQREQRPSHEYSLEKFGLEEADILTAFADYRHQYIR